MNVPIHLLLRKVIVLLFFFLEQHVFQIEGTICFCLPFLNGLSYRVVHGGPGSEIQCRLQNSPSLGVIGDIHCFSKVSLYFCAR